MIEVIVLCIVAILLLLTLSLTEAMPYLLVIGALYLAVKALKDGKP